jgi:hypothetical protein
MVDRYIPTVLHTVTARILPSVFRSSNFIFSYEDETDNEYFICYRTYNLDCPRDVWSIHSRGMNKFVSEHNTEEVFSGPTDLEVNMTPLPGCCLIHH